MKFYLDIFKNAIKLSWKHKHLWFFGLFITLLSGGGEYQFVFRGMYNNENNLFPGFSDLIQVGFFSKNTLINIGQLFKNDPASFLIITIIFLIFLALVIFLIWLAIISQAGIINNTAKTIKAGKKKVNLTIKEGVAAGTANFWKILGINVLYQIIVALLFAAISWPIVLNMQQASVMLELTYIALFIILIPITLAIALIGKYAIHYLIIFKKSFKESIILGAKLLNKNWLQSFAMIVWMFLVAFLVTIAILVALLIAGVPLLFIAFLIYRLSSFMGFWIVTVLGIIIIFATLIWAGMMLNTFQSICWVDFFLKINKKK